MKILHSLFLSFAVFLLFTQAAQARIDIVPRKVVIEGKNRMGEITILNLGDTPSTFRIEMINLRQDVDGVYHDTGGGPLNPSFDPEKIIRLSPRQFTLPAKGLQKIRFSLRPPPDLPPGEYRFHLKAMEFSEKHKDDTVSKGKNVSMKMNLGVSIPVVYRYGPMESGAKISTPTIIAKGDSGEPELHFRLDRTGTASAVGGLKVFWEPQAGEAQEVFSIGNMNIFTEIDHRAIKIPMSKFPSGPGNIRIRYKDDTGEKQVFDEIVMAR